MVKESPYAVAIRTAMDEIKGLLEERKRIDLRMKDLNRTLSMLMKLTDLPTPMYPANMGLTDAVRAVLRGTKQPNSSSVITKILKEMEFDFSGYSNPQASVNGTLMRLVDAGEAKKTWIKEELGGRTRGYLPAVDGKPKPNGPAKEEK